MTGKLKVLSLADDIEGLKEKKSYTDVTIHFRDLHNHTLILKNKKEFILDIQKTSIEAESLLLEVKVDKIVSPLATRLRFYPEIPVFGDGI